jgi:hypothetical protein
MGIFMQYTYNRYLNDIDYLLKLESSNLLTEGVINDVLSGIKGKLGKVFLELEKRFKNTGINTKELLIAFKNKNMFSLLKFVKFSIKRLLNIYKKADTLIKNGVLKPFEILAKNSTLLKEIQKGGKALDNFLDEHPILKKMSGVAVAGILLYIWLNMTFIGSVDYDFDFSSVLSALLGNFSIETLFTTPQGISMLSLFFVGATTGISIPWFGHTVYNLLFGITYTILKQTNKTSINILNKIKEKIKKGE